MCEFVDMGHDFTVKYLQHEAGEELERTFQGNFDISPLNPSNFPPNQHITNRFPFIIQPSTEIYIDFPLFYPKNVLDFQIFDLIFVAFFDDLVTKWPVFRMPFIWDSTL